VKKLLALLLLIACVNVSCAQPGVAPADSPLAPAAAPGVASPVTIKGVILSTWHFYKHEMPANQSPKGTKDHFDLVMYAFDGPPDVQKTLQEVLEKYPKDGVNADAALAIQEQFDQRLLYYIDTGDPKQTDKLAYDNTWVVAPASVTGTVIEKDGKRWLTGAKVTVEKYKAKVTSATREDLTSFKYPSDCMLWPDKPLVMPKEKPIDLKIADNLTLKCVPIPPGRFIMGSPFYQLPRYQDECPIDVTLTKTFYFSEIPITQEMFEAVMGKDANRSHTKGPQLAVENTPFPDIREFCRIL
jgi:hypothetical protein